MADLPQAPLPVDVDRRFLADARASVRALAPSPHRVLLLASAIMKYQLNVLTWFFDQAPLKACDLFVVEHADRILGALPKRVRVLARMPELQEHYDAIVGFNCTQPLLQQCALRAARGVFVGFPDSPPSHAPAVRLPRPIAVFSTKQHRIPWGNFEACFGPGNAEPRDGIDLPPNIPCHYAVPPTPRIEVLLPGGGARDYGAALRDASLFGSQVLVSHADAELLPGDRPEQLEILAADPRFALRDWARPDLYASWLLHSRLVWLPVRDTAEGDYTSAADAFWYGKPVLTTLVRANAHLRDRVLHYETAEQLASHLRLLADASAYAEVSARVRAAARSNNNLFVLLARMWDALCR